MLFVPVLQLRDVVVELKGGQVRAFHFGQLGTTSRTSTTRCASPRSSRRRWGALLVTVKAGTMARYALAGTRVPTPPGETRLNADEGVVGV